MNNDINILKIKERLYALMNEKQIISKRKLITQVFPETHTSIYSNFCQMLKGTRNISIDIFTDIANYFNVSIDYLLCNSDFRNEKEEMLYNYAQNVKDVEYIINKTYIYYEMLYKQGYECDLKLMIHTNLYKLYDLYNSKEEYVYLIKTIKDNLVKKYIPFLSNDNFKKLYPQNKSFNFEIYFSQYPDTNEIMELLEMFKYFDYNYNELPLKLIIGNNYLNIYKTIHFFNHLDSFIENTINLL